VFIFDTDVLSNIVKKEPSKYLLERLKILPKNVQFTTSINIGEIYYGAARSMQKEKILNAFKEKVFPNITVLPFESESAEIYGNLKAKLEKIGMAKSEPDLRIASIAIQYKMVLVTGNIKHFIKIPSLKVEDWIMHLPYI
jgi:predicted nucleic acid-binding protein